jgi:hypothetical protein
MKVIMPSCENCGQEYKPGKKSCKSCGASLDPTASLSTQDDINNNPDAEKRRKPRRSQTDVERSNTSLEFFACGIGLAVILLTLALLSPGETKYLINGNLGILYTGGAILAILMKLFIDSRSGYSIARSLIETVLIGGVTYLLIYGVFWYIEANFIQTDHPLFTSPTPTIKTPTPLR